MTLPFETSTADIAALTDNQLTELLHRLLLLEALKLGLPKSRVSVSLKIEITDGGEDGRIEWNDGPSPAAGDWIPRRLTLFQVKATEMGPTACGEEVFADPEGTPKVLKRRLADVVEKQGAYVLCYGRPCEGTHVADRVTRIRSSFAEAVGKERADAVFIDVYGAEKLATWTNEHAAAVTFVLSSLGRGLPASLQSWASWERDHQSLLLFHPDESRAAIMSELVPHLTQGGKVARIAGLSGLGKTRLALHALRPANDPNSDPEQAALSAACVYVGDGDGSAEEIRRLMYSWREHNMRGVIVVDECPLELHRRLEPIAAAPGSTLSLLTLDYDPDSDPRSSRCLFYRLDPLNAAHIEAMLRESQAQIPPEHLTKVAAYAQGFPLMAERLADALRNDQINLWELAPIDVAEKLVTRRSRDPNLVLRVARALAVLDHLGVDGVAAHELRAFSEHLCQWPKDEVHAVIRELEVAGLVYRRGDYVRIRPMPIAIALAAQWWNGCSEERARELLLGDALPPEVVDATANQLIHLSDHPWVKRLVASIYGPDSPFRRRDLLDSARGSRLASSLAEVNPKAVCEALSGAFGAMSPEEARGVREGRRHLVWCLEKLAWWPETFDSAAWLLLLFAAGENETWSNNATNDFCSLFHVYLSGTETPAMNRLAVLKRAIAKNDPALDAVVVRALGEALAAGGFTRVGGVEAQGGKLPREDWQPKRRADIWDYWREAVRVLVPFLRRESNLGTEARKTLGGQARGMILAGGLPIVEEVIKSVREHRGEWPEMLDGLRCALNYDGTAYDAPTRERVELLVAQLEPRELASRLRHTVTSPGWGEIREEPDGTAVMVAEERAQRLAVEVGARIEDVIPLLPGLQRGEQRQGYVFGKELALRVDDPLGLLERVVGALRSVPAAERNSVVAMGAAEGSAKREPERTRRYVRSLLDDGDLSLAAVDMLRALGANDEDVGLVADRIERHAIPVVAARGFSFGGALGPLQGRTVARLAAACASVDEKGPLLALELLGMRIHSRPLDAEMFEVTKGLLLHPRLMRLMSTDPGARDAYHFGRLSRAYLAAAGDVEFAALLARQVLDSMSSEAGCPPGRGVTEVLLHLIQQHRDRVWPVLRAAFARDEDMAAVRLELALEDVDLVKIVGQDHLLAWCEESPQIRPWVTRMVRPLREEPGEQPFSLWTPFATALLDRYGSERAVLSALSGQIHSGSWSGSAVPRLTLHRNAFAELLGHSKPEVVAWAQGSICALDIEIEREKKRDEQEEFGVYR